MSGIEKVAAVKRLGEEEPQKVYWLSRPVSERIAAVEQIRREFHGWTDESEPRLQRVCRILHRT